MTTHLDPSPESMYVEELRNFQELLQAIRPSPGALPQLPGLDIAGLTLPLRGQVGGDHIIYIDFNRRYDLDGRIAAAQAAGLTEVAENLEQNRHRAGILLADVSGHRITDAVYAAMLHQAFLLGTRYELDISGEITTRLFEHIKTRFYESSHFNRYLTMIYGEISHLGRFRFISAGHPPPVVFSRKFGKLMGISKDRSVTFSPVGMFPSSVGMDEKRHLPNYGYEERYAVNEINLLGAGDLLILATDGFFDHADGNWFPAPFESVLSDSCDKSAADICSVIQQRFLRFAQPVDDVSVVVIKKS